MRRQCKKYGNNIAVISQHQNEIITYSELNKRSDELAAGMLAVGVKRGDRVAVLLGNRSEYVDVSRLPIRLRRRYINVLMNVAIYCMCKDRVADNFNQFCVYTDRDSESTVVNE